MDCITSSRNLQERWKTEMSKPRALTAEEIREEFLQKFIDLARYWANSPNKTPLEQCEGLAFSILNIFDGCSDMLPAFDITAASHPDDKEDHERHGENWYEAGTHINNCMLHEEFSAMLRNYDQTK